MIELQRHSTPPAGPEMPIRAIGLGNAGVSLIDRLVLDLGNLIEFVAINTDVQSLTASVCENKLLVGQKSTRGLGAGGDPELAAAAAAESQAELLAAVEGCPVIFLLGGLGGGTASGLMPDCARLAREKGAFVVSVVTLPFSFEGKRRQHQAEATLQALQSDADLVIAFENDRMSELTQPTGPLQETFAESERLLATAVRSLISIIRGRGPMQITLGDLCGYLKGGNPLCLFGLGEATGPNRAHDALARALRSPLLDRGKNLERCMSLLLHASGPADLSYAEVQIAAAEVAKLTEDHTRIALGISTTAPAGSPLRISLLGIEPSSHAAAPTPVPVPRPFVPTKPAPASVPIPVRPAPVVEPEPELTPVEAEFPEEPNDQLEPAAADHLEPNDEEDKDQSELFAVPEAPQTARPMPASPTRKPPTKIKQETLQFEPVARGRFEKSEPTIIEGEDLDVPAYLRLKIRLK